jgi:hypothetical protein
MADPKQQLSENIDTSAESHPPTQTARDIRNESLALIEQGIENAKATHGKPPQDHPALSLETYAPGIDFVANCKSYLSTEDYAKFSASFATLLGADGAGDEMFGEAREACLALLDGRDDLKGQWDQFFGNREMWAKLRQLRREQRNRLGRSEERGNGSSLDCGERICKARYKYQAPALQVLL